MRKVDRCCVPGCKEGGATMLRSHKLLCRVHGGDWEFIETEIDKQAVVASALAMVAKSLDAPGDATAWGAVCREGARLQAMQDRRIQYLKLSGFDKIDEGI